jgi:hypothetical protein
VAVPDGWEQRDAAAGRLEVGPTNDADAGLTVTPSDAALRQADQATPVLLGRYEAWRHQPVRVKGGGRTVRYVVPTRQGKVSITCAASSQSAPSMLALCERTAATLELRSQRSLPLAAVAKAEQRWSLAAGRLRVDRTRARRKLAGADRQAGQILAAEALQRVYERAAARFAKLAGGEPVVTAAREAAAGYRAMALAADRDARSAWQAAVSDVRRAEAAVNRAIAAG